MGTLTITTKGQVTLRQELLCHLGVAPGDRIELITLRNQNEIALDTPARSVDVAEFPMPANSPDDSDDDNDIRLF